MSKAHKITITKTKIKKAKSKLIDTKILFINFSMNKKQP